MFRLDEKVVLITGGGSGIGRAISELFAKQGAHVHILELDVDNANNTVAQIQSEGGSATAHICNVTNQKEVIALFDKIGRIDILINNAGIAHVGKESNLAGLIYFIKNVPEKRPTIKPTIAIDPHHNAASFSGRFITNFEKRIKKLPTHTCAPT